MSWVVSSDTGGTFTDLVALSDEGKVEQSSHVATLPATARGTLDWIGLDNLRPG